MIIHWNLQQRTPEWHEMKWGKIGGSTSKGLFVPSDTLLLEILSEHTEPFEIEPDPFVNYDMKRGMDLEPVGRTYLEKYTGLSFKDAGWLQCEENELLGISPDGITEDETISCEGKCPGRKKHIETVFNQRIPSDNIHQCLHYFTINPKLVAHWYFTFRPESDYPFWCTKLTRDSVIDLGTKAKPNCKTISEWVTTAKFNAKELAENLKLALERMERI